MLLINRDFEVLRLLCELALETGSMWIEPAAMMKAAEDSDLSAEYVAESLSVLRHRRLVDARESINGEVLDVEVTPVGFDAFALRFLAGYESLLVEAAHWLFDHREGGLSNEQLSEVLGIEAVLANHVIHVFASRGWLRYGEQDMRGWMPVYDVSPELSRLESVESESHGGG